MKSLHDGACRQEILARLSRLAPESRARWGRMHVGQMLCHLGDSLRMALGELETASKKKRALQTFPLKHLILYVLPFPKGAPTAPELLGTKPAEFAADRERVARLVEKLAAAGTKDKGPEHPLLGVLSGVEWGVLQHKHLDHHLRQFGV